jgi:hypothetical protein
MQDSNTGPDAGNDVSAQDAPVDTGPACNLANPFSTPTILASLNNGDAGNTRGAHLSVDYLTAYYAYGSELYFAARTTPSGDTFMNNTLLSSLATVDAALVDNSPTVSSDGLTIYFSSNRSGVPQIYFATRTTITGAFGAPAVVTGLGSGPANTPFLQGDGSTLYFLAPSLDAGLQNDIFRATVTGVGALSNVEDVPELNTPIEDGPIGVTANGLIAYFSRVESIDGGPASNEKIWTASRTSTSMPFSNLAGVAELEGPDSENDDFAWISNDGCQVTLSSFRGVGSNIYIANK